MIPFVPEKGAYGRIAQLRGLRQNLLHPRVRGKGFALLDANGRKETTKLGVKEFDRLAINHGVEFFVELVVGGVNGIELRSRSLDELHLRRIMPPC